MIKIDFHRLKLLIVEDNVHMRKIMRAMLHGFGARDVYEAEEGAAGLEAFQLQLPDIVIADWLMPIVDGIEMTRMIRDQEASANPFAPIILVTAHSEQRRVAQARDAGVTEVLCKPLSAKSLYHRVANIVINPRSFIRSRGYFGPDRRRFENPRYSGTERRTGKNPGKVIEPNTRFGTDELRSP